MSDPHRLTPLLVLERIARRLPIGLGLWLADGLGRAYARLALSTGASLHPWHVENFPAELGALLGEPVDPAERRRLVTDRLAFVLTQWLVRRAVRGAPARVGRDPLLRIVVRGAEHLREALARGRGAFAISTHFGFSHLIGLALDRAGIPWVAIVGAPWRAEHIRVSADVWSRTLALRRIRTELSRNKVCIMLPDRAAGPTTRVPFLRGHLDLGLGAFRLAERTETPLLPFFIRAAERPPRFQVEFSTPVELARPGRSAVHAAIEEFTSAYAACVRRHPSHLPYHSSGRLLDGRSAGQETEEMTDGAEDLG
jgi:lauroyl/myristoyl acyltransferase